MLKSQLKLVGAGEDSLLCVYGPPHEALASEVPSTCMAIPLLVRDGGILLAIPSSYILPHALTDGQMESDESLLFGPSKEFSAPLIEEDDDGSEKRLEEQCRFLVVDLTEAALESLREYDVIVDPTENIQPFSTDNPQAVVDVKFCMPDILDWIESLSSQPRLNFYSAREEPAPLQATHKGVPATKKAGQKKITTAALAQQVEGLTLQLALLASQQEEILRLQKGQPAPSVTPAKGPQDGLGAAVRLPPVSEGFASHSPPGVTKAAALMGPPPKVREALRPKEIPAQVDTGLPLEEVENVGESQMTRAIMQQSTALTALIAHLTTGDPLSELSASSTSGQSLSTKGVQRREKLQQDLATGSSTFFLQVQQQLFRKMFPARQIPKTETELIESGASMTAYMERFGGLKGKPDQAMTLWMLAHCMDAGAQGDFRLMKEYVALTAACVEQSALDGNWAVASVLALIEEPPVQVFTERTTSLSTLGRPFSPMIPAAWSAIALSFIKEMTSFPARKQRPRGQSQTSQIQSSQTEDNHLHSQSARGFQRGRKQVRSQFPRAPNLLGS